MTLSESEKSETAAPQGFLVIIFLVAACLFDLTNKAYAQNDKDFDISLS